MSSLQIPNLATIFCLGKAHEEKRPGWGQNDSPLGSSLCPIYQEEALKEQSLPGWSKNRVPEFVVNKLLAPFCPAHHPCLSPWLPDSLGLGPCVEQSMASSWSCCVLKSSCSQAALDSPLPQAARESSPDLTELHRWRQLLTGL